MNYRSKAVLDEAHKALCSEELISNLGLLALAQKLAHRFYEMHGYKADPTHDFQNSTHPQEQLMWEMGCYAIEELRLAEMQEAIDEYEDEYNG